MENQTILNHINEIYRSFDFKNYAKPEDFLNQIAQNQGLIIGVTLFIIGISLSIGLWYRKSLQKGVFLFTIPISLISIGINLAKDVAKFQEEAEAVKTLNLNKFQKFESQLVHNQIVTLSNAMKLCGYKEIDDGDTSRKLKYKEFEVNLYFQEYEKYKEKQHSKETNVVSCFSQN